MPRFRYAVLEKDKAKGTTVTSGTETIDLPEKDILSEVTVQARSLGAYSDDLITPMDVIIKKIELLVDGSTVVKSLTGNQIRALMWYNKGPFSSTNDYWGEDNNNARYQTFPLYLGRFCGDTKAGLDLGAYSNPQLKITWDASTISWDGCDFDYHSSPTFTYSVIAKIIDGMPAGFTNNYIQSREIDTWGITGSAEHTTEIPRGFPLWSLMWRGAYLDKNPELILAHLKLDFDNGKWMPLDMDYAQLFEIFKTWYPEPCNVNMWVYGIPGDHINPRLLKISGSNITTTGNVALVGYLSSSRRNLQSFQALTATTAQATVVQSYWFQLHGYGPHQTIFIPMKQLTDGIEEAIPTTDYARIDLKTTTGVSGSNGTEHLVAEYLKPNGQ